eukprot:gene4873-7520_t
MGISGLLMSLKSITRECHVRSFSGQRVGVDTYCWLHKFGYNDAEQLCTGKGTTGYLRSIVKRVEMLQRAGLYPVMVFDGADFPLKSGTNAERRAKRSREQVRAELLKNANRVQDARAAYGKGLEITPAIAQSLIRVLRAKGVECIVAPFEADAQLAYLAKTGYIDLVITEDSDLVAHGTPRTLFKMDHAGKGQLIEFEKLTSVVGNVSFNNFTHEMFLLNCILSGCDYLSSLRGIGIVKANKLVRQHKVPDTIFEALHRDQYENIEEYRTHFTKAFICFKHHIVYDPVSHRAQFANPVGEALGSSSDVLKAIVGEQWPEAVARKICWEHSLNPATGLPFTEDALSRQDWTTLQNADAFLRGQGGAAPHHAAAQPAADGVPPPATGGPLEGAAGDGWMTGRSAARTARKHALAQHQPLKLVGLRKPASLQPSAPGGKEADEQPRRAGVRRPAARARFFSEPPSPGGPELASRADRHRLILADLFPAQEPGAGGAAEAVGERPQSLAAPETDNAGPALSGLYVKRPPSSHFPASLRHRFSAGGYPYVEDSLSDDAADGTSLSSADGGEAAPGPQPSAAPASCSSDEDDEVVVQRILLQRSGPHGKCPHGRCTVGHSIFDTKCLRVVPPPRAAAAVAEQSGSPLVVKSCLHSPAEKARRGPTPRVRWHEPAPDDTATAARPPDSPEFPDSPHTPRGDFFNPVVSAPAPPGEWVKTLCQKVREESSLVGAAFQPGAAFGVWRSPATSSSALSSFGTKRPAACLEGAACSVAHEHHHHHHQHYHPHHHHQRTKQPVRSPLGVISHSNNESERPARQASLEEIPWRELSPLVEPESQVLAKDSLAGHAFEPREPMLQECRGAAGASPPAAKRRKPSEQFFDELRAAAGGGASPLLSGPPAQARSSRGPTLIAKEALRELVKVAAS